MKNIMKITTIVLLLATSYSCKNKMNNNEEVTDPETAILGKWELVLLKSSVGNEQKQTPTGYVEYLPEGRLGWYDYTTKEYTLFEHKYWVYKYLNVEAHLEDVLREYWVLEYEKILAEWEYPDGEKKSFPVGPFQFFENQYRYVANKFRLKFINQNTISLYGLDIFLAISVEHIYKRIK